MKKDNDRKEWMRIWSDDNESEIYEWKLGMMKILLMAKVGPKVVVETESLDGQEINGITTVYSHENHSIFFWPTSPQLQPKIL